MGCPPLSFGFAHWTHIEKGLLAGTRLVTALGARVGGEEKGSGRGGSVRGGKGETKLKIIIILYP